MYRTFKIPTTEEGDKGIGYSRSGGLLDEIYLQHVFGRVITINPFFNESIGVREYMKIKFEKTEIIEVGKGSRKWKMIQVIGEQLDGKNAGNQSKTKFFKSNKELKGQVDALNPGDIVDVTMTKDGNYWNPTAYKKVDGGGGTSTVTASSTAAVSVPPSKADYRRANIELAVEILGEKPKGTGRFEYLERAAELADMIQDYINESGAFQFQKDTSEDIPEMPQTEEEE